MKNCGNKNCKQENPQSVESFSLQKDKKDGRRSSCKSCINERNRNKPKTEEERKRAAINTARYRNVHYKKLTEKREELKKDPIFKLKAAEATARYRLKHPDRILAQQKKEKESSDYKEKRRTINAKSRAKNPEERRKRENERNSIPENKIKRRKSAKQSREKNLGKDCAKSVRRYAVKINRIPKWTKEGHRVEMALIYEKCASLQCLANPEDPFQIDHIIPLQGEEVSGLHTPWNLQILPRSLNVKKRK